jgi:periplasmic protein CpxP/Spy
MKKTLMLIPAFVFALALMAQRPQHQGNGKQERPGMEQRRGMGNNNAFRNLDLTDAQKAQAKILQDEFRSKMQALNENENISVKEQRDARFNLAKEHRTKMNNILTTEQQSQLKEQRAKQQAKMQEIQAKRFENMAEKLALNETQKATLQKEREVQRVKMQSIQQNEIPDRMAFQAIMRERKDKHEATMKSVLTKEQFEKWEEMKKQAPQRSGRGRGHMHGRGMQV